MISVLIPFYNWDVSSLVEDLMQSRESADVEVEILVCDDCSPDKELARQLTKNYGDQIDVISNEVNLGRAKTRNLLLTKAHFNHIIFIDGDSRLAKPSSYLSNYVRALKKHDLIIGGTTYDEQRPTDEEQRLHWMYGKTREAQSAAIRNQTPQRYFFTNNFCCKRHLFAIATFDESLTGYGYEDSSWADAMIHKKIEIHHIDNYVIHKGLKNRDKFLRDADEAIETLAKWHVAKKPTAIRLLEFYRTNERSFHGKILLSLARVSMPLTRMLIKSGLNYPKLYDLYRLGRLRDCINGK